MKRIAFALAAIFTAACVEPEPPASRYAGDPGCKAGDEDRAWLEGAPAAWSLVQNDVFRLEPLPTQFIWMLFDAACVYTGRDGVTWTANAHGGVIRTPDGEEHQPGVVSFVTPASQGAFMLMSLPSIWRTAGVNDRGGMSPFLYSVFVHEMTHLRQTGALYDRITGIGEASKIADDAFSDDIVQHRFGDNAGFRASVERERDLLLAGFAGDDAAARAAAGEALALIRARQAKWYAGEDAAFAELEDLFLTLEGMGQLAGYSWLAHPQGAGRTPADAIESMRTRWWSQEEGMAIMLIVQRLVPDWRERAFADNPQTALQLLAEAASGP